MRAIDYAHAFLDIYGSPGHTDDGVLVANLVKTVERHGHQHLLRKIQRHIEKQLQKNEKKRTITVLSSNEVSEQEVAALLRTEPYRSILETEHKIVDRIVDPTLVGGIVVKTLSREIDTSYKRKLIDLYQHAIN
jgi:F0F1-type ATP synthase delta subunit